MAWIVSFLCGILRGRKQPEASPAEEAAKSDDNSGSSDDDAEHSPEKRLSTSSGGPDSPDQPLPPPPGGVGAGRGHMRTVSCQHNRSNSAVSRLVSSLSMRVMGGGGGGAAREEKEKEKEKDKDKDKEKGKKDHIKSKLFKHEDSIWKKTIILGEKCRVPDEGEEEILYDEKGNKFSTYHPKTHSGVLQFSKQTIDTKELSKK